MQSQTKKEIKGKERKKNNSRSTHKRHGNGERIAAPEVDVLQEAKIGEVWKGEARQGEGGGPKGRRVSGPGGKGRRRERRRKRRSRKAEGIKTRFKRGMGLMEDGLIGRVL